MLKADDKIPLQGQEYRLVEPVNRGGQGEVWRATGADGIDYALKTVHLTEDANVLRVHCDNLRAEIGILRQIDRPEADFLIPCLDSGEWHHERFGELPALVMPLMAGSLRQVKQAPDGETLLRWGGQIARAIHRIHHLPFLQRLLSHRDLKPDNLLLTELPGGEIRLCDFGITKQIANHYTRDFAHDRQFFAPEQVLPVRLRHAEGEDEQGLYQLTPACDLYNLGLLLYWLATGDDRLPASQGELIEAALSTAHMEGVMRGERGLLGKVGGMSRTERQQLNRSLLRLFGGNPNETLVLDGGLRQLPDRDYLAERLAVWIDRLLSPDPTDRPTAEDSVVAFDQFLAALAPKANSLSLVPLTDTLPAGEETAFEVRVEGTGLPTQGRWLQLTLADKPFPHQVETPGGDFIQGGGVWRYRWKPSTEDVGEKTLAVTWRSGEGIRRTECRLRITPSPLLAHASIEAGQKLHHLVDSVKGMISDGPAQPLPWLKGRIESLAALPIARYRLPLLIAAGAIGGTLLALAFWDGGTPTPAPAGSPQLPAGSQATGTPSLAGLGAEAVRRLQQESAKSLSLPLQADGFTFTDCPDCPTMAVLPAGEVPLPDGARPLRFEASFAVGTTEVTVAQFRAFVTQTRYQTEAERKGGCYYWSDGWRQGRDRHWESPGFQQSDRNPVVCVSRHDAEAYAEWLSRRSHRSYRLPTEAEWEYAARAGTQTPYWWGDTAPTCEAGKPNGVHYAACGETGSSPVSRFQPSPFGLYDVTGNAWEWTCTPHAQKPGEAAACATTSDPSQPFAVRGGSWGSEAKLVQTGTRSHRKANDRDVFLGFRLVATFKPQPGQ